MPLDRISRQFAFIMEVGQLKEVFRQSLLPRSYRHENDAEHSWHLCLMVMVLAEHSNVPIDVLRVLKMLIIHDIVEIDAGDTYAYDDLGRASQHERETRAAVRIFGLLPSEQASEFRALWDEFEARQSPEAKFAAAIDRVQPMLLNLATGGEKWRAHGVTFDRIVEKNRHVAEGSELIWETILSRLEEALRDGKLSKADPLKV